MTTLSHPVRQRGMTLIEALVGIMLLALIFIAFFTMLDMSAQVAKSQENLSDSTENLRFSVAALVKMTRMAGTGGLPLVYDNGSGLQPLALAVTDNAGGTTLGGRTTVPGSDIITLRGVISGGLYDVPETAVDTTANTVTVANVSPFNGEPQLLKVPSNPTAYSLLISLQLPLNIQAGATSGIAGLRKYSQYRIASVTGTTPAAAAIDSSTTSMTVGFSGSGSSAGLNWGGSFGSFDGALAYSVGFLDQMQYFVATNEAGEPSLYRYRGFGSAEELVPNIGSLQVALGCDINEDGSLAPGEWFLSAANPSAPTGDQLLTLLEVRISVVSRTQEPDPRFEEFRTNMPENAPALSGDDIKYRHRTITVRVALRSHPSLEAA